MGQKKPETNKKISESRRQFFSDLIASFLAGSAVTHSLGNEIDNSVETLQGMAESLGICWHDKSAIKRLDENHYELTPKEWSPCSKYWTYVSPSEIVLEDSQSIKVDLNLSPLILKKIDKLEFRFYHPYSPDVKREDIVLGLLYPYVNSRPIIQTTQLRLDEGMLMAIPGEGSGFVNQGLYTILLDDSDVIKPEPMKLEFRYEFLQGNGSYSRTPRLKIRTLEFYGVAEQK